MNKDPKVFKIGICKNNNQKIKEISEDKIDEKLELVGLLDRKESKFKTFSLGMKQRLAIASALLNDPEIMEFVNVIDRQQIDQIIEEQKLSQSGQPSSGPFPICVTISMCRWPPVFSPPL